MARFTATVESQTGQLAGTPSGTTFNGYFAYIAAAANTGLKLRRAKVGLRAGAAVPTSQQYTVAIYLQTAAPSGTGLAAGVISPLDNAMNDTAASAGLVVTTATTAGTSGPTIGAVALDKITLNTQTFTDVPWEFIEELTCPKGTANGFAFVNIGNTLPGGHFIVLSVETEE